MTREPVRAPWFAAFRDELVAMREQALSDYRDCREEGSHSDAARYDCVASAYGTVLHMLDLRAGRSAEPMDSRERKLHYLLARVLARPRWLSIGSHENAAEFRISRNLYEDAMATLHRRDAGSQKDAGE